MEHLYDTVVIGGGAAGYTAALYAVRAGLDTLVIEKMSAGGQMILTGDIENYPGFSDGIDGFELAMKMQAGAERFGTETKYGEVKSVKLDGDVKEIVTSGGTYFARTVIIATGAQPRELGVPGERELTGRGVHYCAHCDGRFYKDKTTVVVGGGNSGVSAALYLARFAKKVTLLNRSDALKATKIYHEPLMNTPNIEVRFNTVLDEFVVDGKLVGVKVKDKGGAVSEIPCDGVFVEIGRVPVTDLFRGQIELDKNGYIVAGESCETNLPGVFVAGDVRTKRLRQIVTAASDGAVAAHYAQEYLLGPVGD